MRSATMINQKGRRCAPVKWEEKIAKGMPCRLDISVDGRPALWLEGPQRVAEKVVGESFCQDHLMRIAWGRVGPTTRLAGPAWLVPEPENAHDSNAVRVVIAEGKVGYLPRDRAELWQPVLSGLFEIHQRYIACPAEVVGGSFAADGSVRIFGVVLFVPIYLDVSSRNQHISELAAEKAFIERQAQRKAEGERVARLMDHFGEVDGARIGRGEIWQGQTEEMLRAALGPPDDTDERVMKTKKREVYKYRPLGKNRFGLRVTLEDGVVVGWEEKG